MTSSPPLSFDGLAKTAGQPNTGGYPYQLKGKDLDKNFVFATELFHDEQFFTHIQPGAQGHSTRKISMKFPVPQPPELGKYVLGSVDGALTWIATEEC